MPSVSEQASLLPGWSHNLEADWNIHKYYGDWAHFSDQNSLQNEKLKYK